MDSNSAPNSALLGNKDQFPTARRIDFETRFGQREGQRDLKGKTIRSGAITVTGQITKFVLYSCFSLLLARLLTPHDYGLVGMVTSVTGLLRLFKDGGLTTATIQRPTITHGVISTVFWMGLGLALVMTLLATLLAPALVFFYGEPQTYWITMAMASTFLLDAVGAQHLALLRRQMRFKVVALIDLISMIIGSVAAIVAALKGLGYWSLIIQQIAPPFVSLVAVWVLEPWRPGWPSRSSGAGSMVRFGGFYTGVLLLNYIFRNLDNILIGWCWGAKPLGFYQKAYGLLLLPINQVNIPIASVAVSSLSRLHTEPERYRRYFLRGFAIASSITLPIAAASALCAGDIIPLLLGKQWIPAVRLFQLLAPAALLGALQGPLHWLFVASGRTDRQLRMTVPWTILMISGFVFGLNYGPEGVAICYSALSLILALPVCLYALKGTTIHLRDILRSLKYPTVSIIVACGLGYLFRFRFLATAPLAIRAIGGCSAVLGIYALMLLVILRQWNSYRDLVLHLLPSRQSS